MARVHSPTPEPERARLLVATRSAHKLRELRELLGIRAQLVDLDDVGISDEAIEDGETFEANAAIKARFYAAISGMPTLADDSGLEVDALEGGPGVRTKRYAGEDATDERNNVKLLGGAPGPAGGTARRTLPLRPGPGSSRSSRAAWRHPGPIRARHAGGPHRGSAKGKRRLRLRPHLRACRGEAGRPNPGRVDGRGKEPDLAPGQGRPPNAHDPDRAGLLGSSLSPPRRSAMPRGPAVAPLARLYTGRYTTAMDNRSLILARALHLWSERGYDAVGVQEIVEAAGITKPTLYHYFGSKRGLLDELIDERSAGLREALGKAAEYRGDLVVTLESVVRVYFEFARQNGPYYRMQLAFWFAPEQSDGHQAILARNAGQHQALERLFEAAAHDHGNMRGRHRAVRGHVPGDDQHVYRPAPERPGPAGRPTRLPGGASVHARHLLVSRRISFARCLYRSVYRRHGSGGSPSTIEIGEKT